MLLVTCQVWSNKRQKSYQWRFQIDHYLMVTKGVCNRRLLKEGKEGAVLDYSVQALAAVDAA